MLYQTSYPGVRDNRRSMKRQRPYVKREAIALF